MVYFEGIMICRRVCDGGIKVYCCIVKKRVRGSFGICCICFMINI